MSELLDIGGGHTLSPVFDRADRLLGYIHTHPDPHSGMMCQSLIAVRSELTVAAEIYQIEEAQPLRLSPAIRCPVCHAYGYVREGRWVPITVG